MEVATASRPSVAPLAEVRVDGLGVRFDFDRLGRVVTPGLALLRRVRATSWGLRGVDLRLESGTGVALVGPTGSGKTTLLRVLAAVMSPDEGRAEVRGRVGSLLATDAGLYPLLTGRENAELIAVLAGLSLAETRAGMQRVAERSELGNAFDRPVHTYSLGMRARLGLAVIRATSPQILLFDEVYEALDHKFRAIAEDYARELRDRGGIVVAAGHDHPALARICPRAVWLDGGRVVADGPFSEVTSSYRGA
jgi:ABC-type polysaccharide/polyol phosphate transport system ATPase subunit